MALIKWTACGEVDSCPKTSEVLPTVGQYITFNNENVFSVEAVMFVAKVDAPQMTPHIILKKTAHWAPALLDSIAVAEAVAYADEARLKAKAAEEASFNARTKPAPKRRRRSKVK